MKSEYCRIQLHPIALSRGKTSLLLLMLPYMFCCATSGHGPAYNTYSEDDFVLELSPRSAEILAGEDLTITETVTNLSDSRREAYLHFPRVISFRHLGTGEEWSVRDTQIHKICAQKDRFSLKAGQSLSFTTTVSQFPKGKYSMVGELTIAICPDGYAGQAQRLAIRSEPQIVVAVAPE